MGGGGSSPRVWEGAGRRAGSCPTSTLPLEGDGTRSPGLGPQLEKGWKMRLQVLRLSFPRVLLEMCSTGQPNLPPHPEGSGSDHLQPAAPGAAAAL